VIAVIQRVTKASVSIDGEVSGAIDAGMMLLLGVVKGDEEAEVKRVLEKVIHLRIFADENGKMNLSLLDVGGSMLVVSQFTLGANIKRGRRPSFDEAALPEDARKLYELFITQASAYVEVQSGEFGADMQVEIHNDGPVTIIVDSKNI